MGYKFAPKGSYLMPTNFGTIKNYKAPHYTEVTSLSVSFLTDKDKIAELLPESMEPGDPPVVRVACSVCKGVEFLAGGSYNIVQVVLPAVFKGKRDNIIGSYEAAIWESDTYCCILGRELLGVPKLYANIPEPQIEGNNRVFHCSEYGHKLVEGRMENMVPATDPMLKQAQQQMGRVYLLGWKYIPKANMVGADVSNPVATPIANNIQQLWVGEGKHKFFETAWEETPISAQIMKGLQSLKVKEYMPAMITRGSQDLLISEARTIV